MSIPNSHPNVPPTPPQGQAAVPLIPQTPVHLKYLDNPIVGRRCILFFDDNPNNVKLPLQRVYTDEQVDRIRYVPVPGCRTMCGPTPIGYGMCVCTKMSPKDPPGATLNSAKVVQHSYVLLKNNPGEIIDEFFVDSGLGGQSLEYLKDAIDKDKVAAIVLDFDRVCTCMEGLYLFPPGGEANWNDQSGSLEEWLKVINNLLREPKQLIDQDGDPFEYQGGSEWSLHDLVTYLLHNPKDSNPLTRQHDLRAVFDKAKEKGIKTYILTNNGYLTNPEYENYRENIRGAFSQLLQLGFGVDIPTNQILAGGSNSVLKPEMLINTIWPQLFSAAGHSIGTIRGGGGGAGGSGGGASNDSDDDVGTKVYALSVSGKWWPAVITKVHSNGIVDVTVEDRLGTRWIRMPARSIHPRGAGGSSSSS